jgi:nudix-type nucleoside diphosphatase (YffH/AdpP family)
MLAEQAGKPRERTVRAPPALSYMKRDDPRICIKDIKTLARDKGKLMSITFEQRRRDSRWQQRTREVYDNGNSAVVLPYDLKRNTVLLTRQFRLPIYLQDRIERTIEACAGKLDGEKAERRIIKEIEEELGYRVEKVDQILELYVSPASVMEKITFFICAYSSTNKVSEGGGLADEGEDIEVIETTLDEAAAMVTAGEIIDVKTIILIQYLRDRIRVRS